MASDEQKVVTSGTTDATTSHETGSEATVKLAEHHADTMDDTQTGKPSDGNTHEGIAEHIAEAHAKDLNIMHADAPTKEEHHTGLLEKLKEGTQRAGEREGELLNALGGRGADGSMNPSQETGTVAHAQSADRQHSKLTSTILHPLEHLHVGTHHDHKEHEVLNKVEGAMDHAAEKFGERGAAMLNIVEPKKDGEEHAMTAHSEHHHHPYDIVKSVEETVMKGVHAIDHDLEVVADKVASHHAETLNHIVEPKEPKAAK